MFKNYLKIAIRNIFKQKLYSFINIFGLSLGVGCCILIYTFIQHEMSYDEFHQNHKQIYRVITTTKAPDGETDSHALQPVPMGAALKHEIPEVKNAVRFLERSAVFNHKGQTIAERVTFADPAVLQVFTLPLVFGDSETALEAPNSVVLAGPIAKKYFGDENPLGQSLSIKMQDETHSYLVTGVLQDIPDNSSITFDILMPFEKYPFYDRYADNWNSSRTNTYVQLTKTATASELNRKFPPFVKKHLGARIAEGQNEGSLSMDDDAWLIQFQPLKDVHLDTKIEHGMEPTSNPSYSVILGGIALLVLLIACINFMTLAIGRSANRASEVGMRKVMGAVRGQLMWQFLGEAIIMSVLALCIGIAFAELFLPIFNGLAQKSLAIEYGTNWTALLALMLVVGLIAGSYPAVVLSRFQPIEIFKNKVKLGSKNFFTHSLVVLQFTLSIFLMVCTFIMSNQLKYMSSKNLGYNKDQVVVLKTFTAWGSGEGKKLLEIMRNKLISHGDVLNVSGTSFSFARGTNQEGWQSAEVLREAYIYRVDENYLKTLGLKVAAGRDFSPQFPSDPTNSVIVNETLVENFGLVSPELAVGKKLGGYDDGNGLVDPTIIGVLKDFHFTSLRNEITPAFLHINKSWPIWNILVKISPGNIPGSLETLKQIWLEIAPGKPFEYTFMDEDIAAQYASEQRWNKIVSYSTFLAILIACLGLFGLAAILSIRRTKEIGIRKVLGASIAKIVGLVSKQFLVLVALACLVSFPLAFMIMKKWLNSFVYRIEIEPVLFLLTGLLSILVAFLTVFYQSMKAALANPVEALRCE